MEADLIRRRDASMVRDAGIRDSDDGDGFVAGVVQECHLHLFASAPQTLGVGGCGEADDDGFSTVEPVHLVRAVPKSLEERRGGRRRVCEAVDAVGQLIDAEAFFVRLDEADTVLRAERGTRLHAGGGEGLDDDGIGHSREL